MFLSGFYPPEKSSFTICVKEKSKRLFQASISFIICTHVINIYISGKTSTSHLGLATPRWLTCRARRACSGNSNKSLGEEKRSYMRSLSLGGGGCSPPLCGTAGPSASASESLERVLMRGGARRRRLLGVHGRLTWARREGATTAPPSWGSANHGGICAWDVGSRSGMKAGLTIPPAHIRFKLWRRGQPAAEPPRRNKMLQVLHLLLGRRSWPKNCRKLRSQRRCQLLRIQSLQKKKTLFE